MTNLAAWKDTVVVNLIAKLPLQTYETALAYVEDYLSSIGGWVPVDIGDPTGDGAPVNGFTETQAADAIMNAQFARIYSCDLNVSANLKINFHVNLLANQDDASVIASIQTSLQDWIANQFTNAKVTIDDVTLVTGTITEGGVLSRTSQIALNNLVAGPNKLLDPRAIALKTARNTYTLDNTWMVSRSYTEDSKDIVCVIEKYQTTSYLARDLSATNYYVIMIDPNTYALITGSLLRY